MSIFLIWLWSRWYWNTPGYNGSGGGKFEFVCTDFIETGGGFPISSSKPNPPAPLFAHENEEGKKKKKPSETGKSKRIFKLFNRTG